MPCIIKNKLFAIRVVDGTPTTPQVYTFPMRGTVSYTPGGREKHFHRTPDGEDASDTYGVGEGDAQPTELQISDCKQVDYGGGSGFANLKVIDLLNESGPWSTLVTTSGDPTDCGDAKTLHIDILQADGAYWRFPHAVKSGSLTTGPSNLISMTWTTGAPFPEYNAAP